MDHSPSHKQTAVKILFFSPEVLDFVFARIIYEYNSIYYIVYVVGL